jgi:hypothetical protein
VTRYEGVTGRKENCSWLRHNRGDLEGFSTELGELVPRSVACPVSMPHSGVDVIESKLKFHRHWQEQVHATLGDLGVAVSRAKKETPDGIEGSRAWEAFATNG